ncbi:MAG: hypothetical protein HC896_07065 [Bacteroidales bacterium]|nr:hypothetical protein [Bacteroidales bacterium]
MSELSENSPSGVGSFEIVEHKDHYLISTGNLIYNNDIQKLNSNVEEINQKDQSDLRGLKRKVRGQATDRDVGAHIGLIHVGIISSNKLAHSIQNINEKFSYFKVTAKVNKDLEDIINGTKI